MDKIAIVFGGDSLEHDVSIVTALAVMKACKEENIPYLPLYIGRNGDFFTGVALEKKENYLKKKKFIKCSFVFKNGYNQLKVNRKLISISCALLCVHGANTEDGTVGAFFDLLKIPCTNSSLFNASLLQDKHWCKILLKHNKIPVVPSITITKLEDHLKYSYTFPQIVKPAHLGSSIGVKKVQNMLELKEAIEEAFSFDDKIIIENVVPNLQELNIAAIGDSDNVVLSAIEMVNYKDEVLSFSQKYEQFQGENKTRQLPALISEKLEGEIKKYTLRAFNSLECAGVMRFDFLYDTQSQKLYLNEINTIPGSLAFYLFNAIDISFASIIQTLLKLAQKKYHNSRRLIKEYSKSNINNIGQKDLK